MEFFRFLKGMSFERDELKSTLKSDGKPFVIHCAKILESTSEQKRNDMIDELHKFCFQVQGYTTKPKTKHLKKDFIFENYFAYADTLESFASLLRYYRILYEKVDDNSKDEQKFNNYRNFADKVSLELSQRTMTSVKMRELANNYLLNNL